LDDETTSLSVKLSEFKVTPAKCGGAAAEKGSVGEVELPAHKSKNLTLNLKPGHYALIRNIGGHYMTGMHAGLTGK
jgi:uncharacterized cupredoxin-like copper-binding protein